MCGGRQREEERRVGWGEILHRQAGSLPNVCICMAGGKRREVVVREERERKYGGEAEWAGTASPSPFSLPPKVPLP